MKKLALVLGLLLATPAIAADNAVVVTPGVGVTMRSKDIGAGVQSMYHILGDVAGAAIYGTAGTANTNILSVQGIAAMTPLLVTLSGTNNVTNAGTFAVQAAQSGTWTVQPGNTANTTAWLMNVGAINGVTPLMGNGVTGTGSQRVTIASDNTAFSVNAAATLAAETTKVIGTVRNVGNAGAIFDGATGAAVPANVLYNGINIGGNLAGWTGIATGATVKAATVAIVDSSGNQITSFGGSGGTASNYGSAFPSSGTAIGFSDGTNMVAAKVGAVANVAAATNMINSLGIAQYNATPLTVTDTRYQSLQSDVNGFLKVNVAAGGASGGTSSNFGSAFPTPGTAVGMSDGTNMVAMRSTAYGTTPTGLNALAVNAFVTNTNSNGSATSANSAPVVIASDQAAVAVKGNAANGAAVSGNPNLVAGSDGTNARTLTTDSSGRQIVAGGAAAGAAIAGNPVLMGGSDGTNARAVLTGTDGRVAANVSQIGGTTVDTNSGNKSAGSQRVVIATDQLALAAAGQVATGAAPPAGVQYIGANTSGATGGLVQGLIQCDSTAIYDASTNGSTELVALTSGRTIYVCGYSIMAGGTVNVKLIYGTGTACATGSTNMTPAYQLTAQAGISDQSPFSRGLKTASANALCINASAGVAAQAIVYYAKL